MLVQEAIVKQVSLALSLILAGLITTVRRAS